MKRKFFSNNNSAAQQTQRSLNVLPLYERTSNTPHQHTDRIDISDHQWPSLRSEQQQQQHDENGAVLFPKRKISSLIILFTISVINFCTVTGINFSFVSAHSFDNTTLLEQQQQQKSSLMLFNNNSSRKKNVMFFDNNNYADTLANFAAAPRPHMLQRRSVSNELYDIKQSHNLLSTNTTPSSSNSFSRSPFALSSSARSRRFAPPNVRGFTETQILDELFKNYDNRTRPFGVFPNGTFGGPTRVRVNILLRSISKIDDVRMEYTSTLTFREEWADQRLAYDDGGQHEFLVLPDPNKVWKPDLFFYPEKEGWFHAITTPNVLFRIYASGRVLYSVRLSMVLSCFMQLHLFPLDYQNCTLDMASYAYTTDDIIFYWKEDNPVQIKENILNLPRFQLDRVITGDCTVKTNTGAYSCLKVELHFLRQLNYFIFQTYVPSIMLVIASWVSFWLDQDAIPARITLGVTTLLTVITSTHGINAKLPPVSYTKAIDVWTGACTFFVFAALLEFALVNFASRRERPPAPPGTRGGKRALRSRVASVRHRSIPALQQPPMLNAMQSRPISPMHHHRQQQQQQFNRMYSDNNNNMDNETTLFLANSAAGIGIEQSPHHHQYDAPLRHPGGGSGTPRETSFHRFPSPGEDDLFDFTGGPHLRITGPSLTSNSSGRLASSRTAKMQQQLQSNDQLLYRTASTGVGVGVGVNSYLCDRLLTGGGGAPTQIMRHFSRNSLSNLAGVGMDFGGVGGNTTGLFPAPPMSPGGSSSGGGRQFGSNLNINSIQPASSGLHRNATSNMMMMRPNTPNMPPAPDGGGLDPAQGRRGLIGKYFRWPTSTAKKIDFVSRVMFPTAFSVFNCIYWSVYLTARERFRRDNA